MHGTLDDDFSEFMARLFSDLLDEPHTKLAKELKRQHDAFVTAGFDSYQAFDLTKEMLTGCMAKQ
ncbi:hypothetical protein ACFV0L_10570 [Streptosporangium canum]|uniref:hypothetical protein n=1 Tax=Streptosporangium canum TaxID=324952 RepID=UPI0036B647DE